MNETRQFRAYALIVDDSCIDAALLEGMLKDFGCSVDVSDELSFLGKMENSYDIIFVDINMPHIDGFSLAQNIRKSPLKIRDVPIIAVSANNYSPEQAEQSLKSGLDGYVEKPADKEVLEEILVRFLPDREVTINQPSSQAKASGDIHAENFFDAHKEKAAHHDSPPIANINDDDNADASETIVDIRKKSFADESSSGKNAADGIAADENTADANIADAGTTRQFAARALIIEDSRVDAAIAEGLLQEIGCITDISDDLGFPEKMENDYDIIFVDINMPNMDGFSLTKTIRESSLKIKDIPIIAVSGNSYGPEQVENTLKNKLDGYVEKPIDQKMLIEIMAEFLPHKEVTNQKFSSNDTTRPRAFFQKHKVE